MDSWIGNLAQAMLAPVMGLFAAALLTEPAVATGRIAQLWQDNVALANSFYVLYILLGGLIVLGYGTVQTRYTARQIAPRLVLGIAASNLSLPVIALMVQLTGALAGALWNRPLDPAGVGDQVVQTIIAAIMMPDGLTQIVMAIFALVVCVLALAVLVTCAARIAGLMLLTVLAPLALTTHALPGIDGAARLWWRCIAAVLATQLLQTLTFTLMLHVFCDSNAAILVLPTPGGITDFIVGTALLVIMLKIPGWANRATLGSSPRSFIGSVLRTTVVAALGYRLGVPGAYSSRQITGRLIARRIGAAGGGGALGVAALRPRGPRNASRGAAAEPRRTGAESSALIRHHAGHHSGDPAAAAGQIEAVASPHPARAPAGGARTAEIPQAPGSGAKPLPRLSSLGGRGFGSSRGSHPSGQLALWPVPRGQQVPQPWWQSAPAEPAAKPPQQPHPGQLQLPGVHRPAPHPPGPWPRGWRTVPLYTIPRERRAPSPPPPPITAPKPAPEPHPHQPGQLELFTRRQARADQPKPPRRSRRANLAVRFLAPDDQDEATP